MVLSHLVSIDDRWFALPFVLVIFLGPFCLGCQSEEEAKQKRPPPIAEVKLPPVSEARQEEPSKEEILPSTEKKVPKEAGTPPPPSTHTGAVTARFLHVRNAPNLMAEAIGVLPRGERVQILGEEDAWYHIKAYAGYLEGWAAKSYITVSPAGEPGAPPS